MKTIGTLFLFAITTSLMACAQNPSEADDRGGVIEPVSTPIVVEALYAGVRCGRAESGAKASWILDAVQLQSFYNGFRKEEVPIVDFDRTRVVLLEMGQRSTLGYRLALANTQARIIEERAEVLLEWVAPGRGMMVGQMLTSPCLLLKLERGAYHQVAFKNSAGVEKMVLNTPQ